VYRALGKARRRRGALEFESGEVLFDFDASGQVRALHRYQRNEAHKLIEECMILANVAVARELGQRKRPTLFRVHGQPEEKKLDVLLSTLAALGLPGEVPENPTTRDLRAITERMGSAPERGFVESLVVRSMPQALYQPSNIGHFGLALKEYAHFTSPIRRYPDLVVHRTLKRLLDEGDSSGVRYADGELSVMGADLSRLEKRADEADRYVDNFLKCAWLRERIGQTFNGLITTVVEFGCFVQILDAGIDGLLHLDNLRDDEYVMTDDGHGWSGRKNGRKLRAGGHIRVVVTSVNAVEGLIDLDLAPAE
jgi:ribonuclease R